MKVRAKVSYDGTDFSGFQRQKNARSVQDELERAIGKACGSPTVLVGAGRTDAGVHATGQVIAFEVEWAHSLSALTRAINIQLPDDVAVRDLEPGSERFHPRFSAASRIYEYTIVLNRDRIPATRLYTWQMYGRLDVVQMNAAAAHLIGAHDFAAFGAATTGESTHREVFRAEWREIAGEPQQLKFVVEANGFLYRMVRRIVATLVRVGRGKLAADGVAAILQSRDATQVKDTAPASGLCLVDVTFRDEEQRLTIRD